MQPLEIPFSAEVTAAMTRAGVTEDVVLTYRANEAEIEVTTDCQLDCWFGDVACWRFSDNRNPVGEEIRDPKQAQQMMHRLNGVGVSLVNVIASGEPTMKRYSDGQGIEVMFGVVNKLPTMDYMLSSHGAIPPQKWNDLLRAGLRNLTVSYNCHLPEEGSYRRKMGEVEEAIEGEYGHLLRGTDEDKAKYAALKEGNVDVVKKSWFGRKRLLEVGKLTEEGYPYGGIRSVNWVVTPESLNELEPAIDDLTSQGIWVNVLPLDIVPFGGRPEDEFGDRLAEYRDNLARICRGNLLQRKREPGTRLVNSDRYLSALPDLATTGQYQRCFVPDVISVTQTGRITYCTYHMGSIGDGGGYNAITITPEGMQRFRTEWAQDPLTCGGCAPSAYDRVQRFHHFPDLAPPGGDQRPNFWFYHKQQVAAGKKDWLRETEGNLPY